MNSVHDMGGMQGFGAIPREDDHAFHAEWERRIAAILACTAFNGLSLFDENRRAAEAMRPADYLAMPYFGRWLHMIETLLVEKGMATPAEIAAGHRAADGRRWQGPSISAAQVWPAFQGGGSARATCDTPPRFQVGDLVMVKVMHSEGHTRLPRSQRLKRVSWNRYRDLFCLLRSDEEHRVHRRSGRHREESRSPGCERS